MKEIIIRPRTFPPLTSFFSSVSSAPLQTLFFGLDETPAEQEIVPTLIQVSLHPSRHCMGSIRAQQISCPCDRNHSNIQIDQLLGPLYGMPRLVVLSLPMLAYSNIHDDAIRFLGNKIPTLSHIQVSTTPLLELSTIRMLVERRPFETPMPFSLIVDEDLLSRAELLPPLSSKAKIMGVGPSSSNLDPTKLINFFTALFPNLGSLNKHRPNDVSSPATPMEMSIYFSLSTLQVSRG
jgi:hypothetical protein